jgi:hypothetical protein
MITLRRAAERGHADHGWLKTHHTFTFASYRDPAHMGFRALRVINDDRIAPGRGFGAHAHRDMEILTYVLEGRLRHKDSMGEERVFGPNTIQAMSAGTGVVHSEFNPSETEPVHLLQVWITPSAEDFEPSYQQIPFSPDEKMGRLRLLAGPSRHPQQPAAVIHQDALVYAAVVRPGETVQYALRPGRHAWVQVAQGNLSVNGADVATGDGVALSQESAVAISGHAPAGGEFLLFDLA